MANYLQIDGAGLDNNVLISSISCTHGRQNINSQPSPSTFRCTLQVKSGEYMPPVVVGSSIVWKVYNSSGFDSKQTIFTGSVTDVSISLEWSNGQGLFTYNITGVDALADIDKWLVGGSGFAKDYDGNRIKTILQSIDPGIDVTKIETPGAYEIAVYSSGSTNALQLIQEAANSAMGVFYCQPNSAGRFVYQSYLSRKSNTQITLSTSDVLAFDYTVGATSNLVCNQTQLTYGTGSSGTVYNDTASQAIYGIRAGVRSTTLHNSSDANSIAQTLLAARAYPSYSLNSLTVNTAIISDALRTSLSQIEIGTRIAITGLPTSELESFNGYVEGYSWSSARGQDILQMNISNASEQYPYTLWTDLNLTDTWNTYATASTKWSDIT